VVPLSAVLLFAATGIFALQDRAGCADHPLFPTRMPEYRIGSCKVEAFGVYEFFVTKGPKTPVEGKFTYIAYNFTGPRANEPSGLAVVRNYENAIRKAGGTILQSDPQRWVNGKIVKDGQEVWVQAEKGNGVIWLRIVEKKEMEQFIEADAAAFGNDIRATGHAAVYGITFDTGKSTIKPESAQAIGEVAKLLTADPSLKIHVVGHTDNVGGVDSNIKLSRPPGARPRPRHRPRPPEIPRVRPVRPRRLQRHRGGPGQEPPGGAGQTIKAVIGGLHRRALSPCEAGPKGLFSRMRADSRV
jgi:OOP family OmpA-OmpF porin